MIIPILATLIIALTIVLAFIVKPKNQVMIISLLTISLALLNFFNQINFHWNDSYPHWQQQQKQQQFLLQNQEKYYQLNQENEQKMFYSHTYFNSNQRNSKNNTNFGVNLRQQRKIFNFLKQNILYSEKKNCFVHFKNVQPLQLGEIIKKFANQNKITLSYLDFTQFIQIKNPKKSKLIQNSKHLLKILQKMDENGDNFVILKGLRGQKQWQFELLYQFYLEKDFSFILLEEPLNKNLISSYGVVKIFQIESNEQDVYYQQSENLKQFQQQVKFKKESSQYNL